MNIAETKQFFKDNYVSHVVNKGKITELWINLETNDEQEVSSLVGLQDGYLEAHPEGADRGGYIPSIELLTDDGPLKATLGYDEDWVFEVEESVVPVVSEESVVPGFHEAWGNAKDSPDYDKKAWIYVQSWVEKLAGSKT